MKLIKETKKIVGGCGNGIYNPQLSESITQFLKKFIEVNELNNNNKEEKYNESYYKKPNIKNNRG